MGRRAGWEAGQCVQEALGFDPSGFYPGSTSNLNLAIDNLRITSLLSSIQSPDL